MKRYLTLALAVIFCVSASVNASAWGEIKRYAVKSAIVDYTISGSQSGQETLYFEDYGKREARCSEYTIKMFGFQSVTKNATIIDGEWVYSIDLDERQGTRMNLAKLQEMALKGAESQTLKDYSEKALNKIGAVKEGTETVLGKRCQVYSIPKMQMKVWIYNRIALKTTANISGMQMDITATSIKENVSIPADKFDVPADIAVTDFSDEMPRMQNSFMSGFAQ